jgi:ubiquinone/menaquinone biosynthesis C-methylase UbiE
MTLPGFFQGTGMPDAAWWEALWPNPAKVLADVGLEPGMSAVDLCCGDGWFTLWMAKIASDVIGIDIDAALLQTARTRLMEIGISNCTLVEADAFEIGRVLREPADHVLLANVFHGVPNGLGLACAVRDVLKPGGLFAIVNWHAKPREETVILGEPRGPATELRMAPEQTIASVAPSGLTLRNLTKVSPYHYGAVFERVK